MAVFDMGHPGAFTFGLLGNIVSFLVYFAPLPTFIRIYKEKSTMGFDSLPYVVSLFSAMLWMYYALLKTNAFLLISINSFGCFIESIYIFMFLFYAPKKAKADTAKVLGLMDVGLFSFIFLFTYFKFDGTLRIEIVGWICVIISVCVFAAPLSVVVRVVRTKSVEFMPLPLSFFLTLSAVMWFGYGLFERDICIAIPNVLGFSLGVIQMLLYAIFRKGKKAKEIDQEKEQPEQAVNIMVLGTPEVHPVDSEMGQDNTGGKDEEVDEGVELDSLYAISVEPNCQVNVQVEQPPVVVCCAA